MGAKAWGIKRQVLLMHSWDARVDVMMFYELTTGTPKPLCLLAMMLLDIFVRSEILSAGAPVV